MFPADSDGFIQGIRLSLAEQDAQYAPQPQVGKYVPKIPRPKGKEKAKASGAKRLASNLTPLPFSVSVGSGGNDAGAPRPG